MYQKSWNLCIASFAFDVTHDSYSECVLCEVPFCAFTSFIATPSFFVNVVIVVVLVVIIMAFAVLLYVCVNEMPHFHRTYVLYQWWNERIVSVSQLTLLKHIDTFEITTESSLKISVVSVSYSIPLYIDTYAYVFIYVCTALATVKIMQVMPKKSTMDRQTVWSTTMKTMRQRNESPNNGCNGMFVLWLLNFTIPLLLLDAASAFVMLMARWHWKPF